MRVLYVAATGQVRALEESRLESTTERHHIALLPLSSSLEFGDPAAVLARDSQLAGAVLELTTGCPSSRQLAIMQSILGMSRRVWLYWPDESTVECVTPDRLASYRRHLALILFHRRVYEPLARFAAIPRRLRSVLHDVPKRSLPKWAVKRAARTGPALRVRKWWRENGNVMAPPAAAASSAQQPIGSPPMAGHGQRLNAIKAARQRAKPIPFPALAHLPDSAHRVPGCGFYLRTDFWAPMVSGGSYGHTCYVAKELAAVTERVVCYLSNRFPLLDEFGVEQVVMPRPSDRDGEDEIAAATPFYVEQLRPAVEKLRPSFIYERLCLGNYAGAVLSAEFGVPYILEYNGSELSMRRSFEGTRFIYEAEYFEAEALAFEQATLISVVSEEIRRSLLARGVDPAKIVVNPNGVDLTAYAPAETAERDALRHGLGFAPDDRVIGFTGTFGGWHGIEVLSAAIPRIAQASPRARFLLIGAGDFKPLVDRAVASHGLEGRVVSPGRVPQAEGARLLKACDIYVSPHSTHMIDSKFFGSPTKIFEYMALGGGIVASNLEQIGQVLSPALSPAAASAGGPVSGERAVLCAPGDVDEFVAGVLALVERPELARTLGRNARQAAGDFYSWTQHVANLWRALRQPRSREAAADLPSAPQPEPRAANEVFAQSCAYDDDTFDLVYSNGVVHHNGNTRQVVRELFRVLKPGGRAVLTVYAENSLHYWRNLVWTIGIRAGQLRRYSIGEIMSRTVDGHDSSAARPIVKVYTADGLRQLFEGFVDIEIEKRQLSAADVPRALRWMPTGVLEQTMGWNLVIKARKPSR
jgi:glycosyltransferase involved in cell wall biosynthesis